MHLFPALQPEFLGTMDICPPLVPFADAFCLFIGPFVGVSVFQVCLRHLQCLWKQGKQSKHRQDPAPPPPHILNQNLLLFTICHILKSFVLIYPPRNLMCQLSYNVNKKFVPFVAFLYFLNHACWGTFLTLNFCWATKRHF